MWHAMLQLVTQLATALALWGDGAAGNELWLSAGMKVLVVGVVSMERLDDKRMVSLQYV